MYAVTNGTIGNTLPNAKRSSAGGVVAASSARRRRRGHYRTGALPVSDLRQVHAYKNRPASGSTTVDRLGGRIKQNHRERWISRSDIR